MKRENRKKPVKTANAATLAHHPPQLMTSQMPSPQLAESKLLENVKNWPEILKNYSPNFLRFNKNKLKSTLNQARFRL